MPQYSSKGINRPCLIRMKGTGNQKNKSLGPQKSTLYQFEKVGPRSEDQVAEAQWAGTHENNRDSEFAIPSFEKGEWWLRLKMDHPHNAIELIETYKRITGTSHCDVTYQLDFSDPVVQKRRLLLA